MDAPPPPPIVHVGRAYVDPDLDVFFAPDDESQNPRYISSIYAGIIGHEPTGDFRPASRYNIINIHGRRVRLSGDITTRIAMVDGNNPWDFDFARACAESVPPPPTDDHRIVILGFGHRSYAVREAATGVMIRKGFRAIPALVSGLKSSDPEIALRCRRALDTIRNGDPP